jgi:hypothetical protein
MASSKFFAAMALLPSALSSSAVDMVATWCKTGNKSRVGYCNVSFVKCCV